MKRPEESSFFLSLRFVFVLILTIAIMAADLRLKVMDGFRYYLESALYPLLVFANSPSSVSKMVSSQFRSRSELIDENERLSSENYLQRADLTRLHAVELENEAMRKLLNSPLRESANRMFAEIIDVETNPYLQRVRVNRGANAGVYVGMPVLTDIGLVGQVISTSSASSMVLLICDPRSSVPVVDTRNQIRGIAEGTGSHDEILIRNIPRSSDVRQGDMMVSSGLGGVYPEGYPVAVVTSVGFSDDQPFAVIRAKPIVDIDRMRYVLMFWYQSAEDGDDSVRAKQPTDSKLLLRQQRLEQLISTMSVPEPRPGNGGEDPAPAATLDPVPAPQATGAQP
ncbi:MAG: rod shape-determining protein MreC [Succinivibrionaceae bacterium]|nr:rod shape-determining protein MreC [Succinivibrionaceae bacterium]